MQTRPSLLTTLAAKGRARTHRPANEASLPIAGQSNRDGRQWQSAQDQPRLLFGDGFRCFFRLAALISTQINRRNGVKILHSRLYARVSEARRFDQV